MTATKSIPAPKGETWRSLFHSDGSETTGSRDHHGKPFKVIRQLTEDEADPNDDGDIVLWIIEFADGTQFTAWSDEIMVGWTNVPAYRPEDYARTNVPAEA